MSTGLRFFRRVEKKKNLLPSLFIVVVVVQALSCVQPFATPWTAAHQAPLSFISQSLFKLMSIELVMPSNHLVLCCPFLFLPCIFPSIRVLSIVGIIQLLEFVGLRLSFFVFCFCWQSARGCSQLLEAVHIPNYLVLSFSSPATTYQILILEINNSFFYHQLGKKLFL